MFKKVSITLLLLFSVNSFADWTKWIGRQESQYAGDVKQCPDGGFIVAGKLDKDPGSLKEYDFYLVKTDSAGDTLWTKNYGSDDKSEMANSIQICDDSGFIVVGTRDRGMYGDIFALRTKANGDTVWTKIYNLMDKNYGNYVCKCSSGGFLIAGKVTSNTYACLIRIDEDGDTLWTRKYGPGNDEWASCVQECNDGNFIVSGYSFVGASAGGSVLLMKVDTLGDTLWTRTYGTTELDMGYSVQECADNGFIIVAETYPSGSDKNNVYIIRTNSTGDSLWTRIYGGAQNDLCTSVLECSEGGFLVSGESYSFGSNADIYILKLNANGDTTWTKTYDGMGYNDNGGYLAKCASGYIIAGTATSYMYPYILLIRLSSIGVEEKGITKQTTTLNASPNPFNSFANIRYTLANTGHATLKVFDISGKPVRTLINKVQSSGAYNVQWDGKSVTGKQLPNGYYFYQLKTATETRTQKTLLVR
ncbi:MAG: FlgD immunoglobulin-like domain containing protein [bacterium]